MFNNYIMKSMRVFTHYLKKDDVEYRWRTILQFGSSWKVCGTIFMKNPGSSKSKEPNPLPIDDKSVLEHLRTFDDTEYLLSQKWYEFSIDNTMGCVQRLFEAYYNERGESLNGVIQIFNLFNIRDANLGKALDKLKGNVIEDLAFTTAYDINHIVYPVFIGWGNLWVKPILNERAKDIFNAVKQKTSYLCSDIIDNNFYHPQYLMGYGRNREKCKEEKQRFINSVTP